MKGMVVRSLVFGGLVLGAGIGGMLILLSVRKAPAEASGATEERSIRVDGARAIPEDVVVRIPGYGEARPVRSVEIAPEVSGTVESVHPHLVVGGVVEAGAVLFSIDPWVYESQLVELEAQLARWGATLSRLETEYENDADRLTTLERTNDLSRARYDRAVELFGESIGNRTEMDEAEQQLNDTADRVNQLRRQVAVYPALIEEAKQSMAAEKARKQRAETSIARTQVRAPFDARVTAVHVEEGAFLALGATAVGLADDSSLEVAVKLDATDARDWLRFDEGAVNDTTAWFSGLSQVPCEVRWVEEASEGVWQGVLDRVEAFDSASRTLTVTIRVAGDEACGVGAHRLPLVAGMFCEVVIPGRVLEDVYRLPQWAVGVDGTTYLAKDGRLRATPVEILHSEGETVFVSGAIEPRDLIVTTRLINPMENTLLDVSLIDESDASSTD